MNWLLISNSYHKNLPNKNKILTLNCDLTSRDTDFTVFFLLTLHRILPSNPFLSQSLIPSQGAHPVIVWSAAASRCTGQSTPRLPSFPWTHTPSLSTASLPVGDTFRTRCQWLENHASAEFLCEVKYWNNWKLFLCINGFNAQFTKLSFGLWLQTEIRGIVFTCSSERGSEPYKVCGSALPPGTHIFPQALGSSQGRLSSPISGKGSFHVLKHLD